MITGESKIDGITVIAAKIDVGNTGTSIIAKATLVTTDSGQTHAVIEHHDQGGWSEGTLTKAVQLIAAIEEDMAQAHFKGPQKHGSTGVIPEGGIGEHLDAMSV